MITVQRIPELIVATTGDPLENILLGMVAIIGLAGYFSLLVFFISGFVYWLRPRGVVADSIKYLGWEKGYKKYWGNLPSFKFLKMIAPKVLTPMVIYKAAMLQGDYFLALSLSGLVAGVFVVEAAKSSDC